MTSRGKNALRGFETEIERCREEANWKKAVELATQLKARSANYESLAHFLIGEGKLEVYLEEWPPVKENFERAQRELSEAYGYLMLATDDSGQKAGVALDAHLLLGKLNYAKGCYEDALKHYKLAELDTLTEKELPVRSLRIVAESFAIKGLCLEQAASPAPSRFKMAERDAEMIRSYEISCDLTLVYLQRAAGGVGGAGGKAARAGIVLETALQRAPILHMQAHRLTEAVDRYRSMLRAVESPATQALRLTLARQLAEVLLRGLTGQVYSPPKVDRVGYGPPPPPPGPWRPKKYANCNQFIPTNCYEEIILVLVVGEAMAARDAVLSQSAEFAAARDHALGAALALMDLLALALARWGRLALLRESLERATKFSHGCAHLWRQRFLACAAAAPPAPLLGAPHLSHAAPPPATPAPPPPIARARAVAKRATALCEDDAALALVAANTAYTAGHLEEGIEYAAAAARAEEQREGPLLARACLMAAVGHLAVAHRTRCRVERESSYAASSELLRRSLALDDNDHLAFYYLALQKASQGQLNDAMDACRRCLSLRAECGGALSLCCALWSCGGAGGAGGAGGGGGRGGAALQVALLTAHHYPHRLWPRAAAAHLQLVWASPETALETGKELLRLLGSGELDSEMGEYTYTELDALSDSRDDTSVRLDVASVRESVSGARTRAASSAASSSSAPPPPPPAQRPRALAWLTLAELCLRAGRTGAAAGCVSEAAALAPATHRLFYTRGLVHMECGEWECARACFQDALALDPHDVDTLIQLGGAYYSLGWLRLSEAALRGAVALCPGRAEAWRRLSLSLWAVGDSAAAADAAIAALQAAPADRALPLPPPLPLPSPH